jgi:hypothetical protein
VPWIRFARVRWSGTDTAKNRHIHGFAYVHLSDTVQVRISGDCPEPEHTQVLALCEAAAMTFGRTGPSRAPSPPSRSAEQTR